MNTETVPQMLTDAVIIYGPVEIGGSLVYSFESMGDYSANELRLRVETARFSICGKDAYDLVEAFMSSFGFKPLHPLKSFEAYEMEGIVREGNVFLVEITKPEPPVQERIQEPPPSDPGEEIPF